MMHMDNAYAKGKVETAALDLKSAYQTFVRAKLMLKVWMCLPHDLAEQIALKLTENKICKVRDEEYVFCSMTRSVPSGSPVCWRCINYI